tara:strand:+ start:1231 stop:1932 length:702 start_codon:yes stop_codon:yes gene_type:complete
MAVSVDTVYQTVLALANKEQRGYITPQEFNLHAEHAQMHIFEQYFYDLNQFKRTQGNSSNYADMTDLIEDKIQIFKRGEEDITSGVNIITGLDSNLYRISGVTYDTDNGVKTVERIKHEEYNVINQSPLTKPTSNRPVYWLKNNIINFAPDLGTFQIRYIVKPKAPKWTYTVVDEKPLYNPNIPDFQNFELHPSEQEPLVVKILQLSGVTMKDYNLAQVASQEETKNIQQEKQ